MRIIVVGAGKVGTSLTAQLIREHRVTVIDQEPKLIENIINVYDVMGVCGNGASYEVQKEAEVGKADLLIATTSSDEINILACLVAKKLGVAHTIARIRNPEYETQLRFMRGELGLTMSINPEKAAAHEIAGILLKGPLRTGGIPTAGGIRPGRRAAAGHLPECPGQSSDLCRVPEGTDHHSLR